MTVLTTVQIKNFQSLYNVELELKDFTVIVGPSSSGKSAFFRAMKTLVSNQRGSSFISHGERVCTISGQFPNGRVTLKRGRGTDDNSYSTIDKNDVQEKYTKLHGATPEEVSQFMGIPSKSPINMVGQFDKPYLLDDSASEVAKVLGDLTNVRVIFEGARESNRRKLSESGVLKTRKEDLDAALERVETFRPLAAQLEAIEAAESNLEALRGTENKLDALRHLQQQIIEDEKTVENLEPIANRVIPSADSLMEQLRFIDQLVVLDINIVGYEEAIERYDAILAREVPSADRMVALKAELMQLQEFVTFVSTAKTSYVAAKEQESKAKDAEILAQQSYIEALHEMGVCPTCKQSTKEITNDMEH